VLEISGQEAPRLEIKGLITDRESLSFGKPPKPKNQNKKKKTTYPKQKQKKKKKKKKTTTKTPPKNNPFPPGETISQFQSTPDSNTTKQQAGRAVSEQML